MGCKSPLGQCGPSIYQLSLRLGGNVQPAPGIERIVDLKLRFNIFQIIRKAEAVAHSDSFETRRQGVVIESIRIRRINDPGHPQKTPILQLIIFNDDVKRAKIITVMEFGARYFTTP